MEEQIYPPLPDNKWKLEIFVYYTEHTNDLVLQWPRDQVPPNLLVEFVALHIWNSHII